VPVPATRVISPIALPFKKIKRPHS
jgi:hypothetical protein